MLSLSFVSPQNPRKQVFLYFPHDFIDEENQDRVLHTCYNS